MIQDRWRVLIACLVVGVSACSGADKGGGQGGSGGQGGAGAGGAAAATSSTSTTSEEGSGGCSASGDLFKCSCTCAGVAVETFACGNDCSSLIDQPCGDGKGGGDPVYEGCFTLTVDACGCV